MMTCKAMTLTGRSMIILTDMAKRKKKFTESQEWSYKNDFPIGEVWGTCHILSKLIVPRLRTFKALDKQGYAPGFKDIADWNRAIQKMIDAFDLLEDTNTLTEEDNKKVEEGLALFCKHFRNLWD